MMAMSCESEAGANTHIRYAKPVAHQYTPKYTTYSDLIMSKNGENSYEGERDQKPALGTAKTTYAKVNIAGPRKSCGSMEMSLPR